MSRHGTCPKNGKARFCSHEAALMRGGELMTKYPHKYRSFSAYRCQHCNSFHLTSNV